MAGDPVRDVRRAPRGAQCRGLAPHSRVGVAPTLVLEAPRSSWVTLSVPPPVTSFE